MSFYRAIDGETRIGIFATRDIRKEEELTYDYQYVLLIHLFFCALVLGILHLFQHAYAWLFFNSITDYVAKICRFVQFGADQDCYCGALGCRQKLGNKHSKLKLSSDTDVQLTLFEVAPYRICTFYLFYLFMKAIHGILGAFFSHIACSIMLDFCF